MKVYRNEDGEYHRVNGPAIEFSDGDYAWRYNGELHRYYGVARCWNGKDEYFIFGEWIR